MQGSSTHADTQSRKTPAVLLILDGWGHRDEADNNAIFHAYTPYWDKIWHERPHTLIQTSGEAVGLPEGQMGNSEVGHMNLGAGRTVYQSLTRIDKDVREGGFAENPVIGKALQKAVANNSRLHVFGLVSSGGVHSSEDHILALCDAAKAAGVKRLRAHAFLDGRDTPPRSADVSLEKLQSRLATLSSDKQFDGRIATIIGRYYAMDRDNRWDRVKSAYDLLTDAKAEYAATDALAGLEAAYERGENDEFVKATAINDADGRIEDGDVIIFMNFRADRARQLSRAFVHPEQTDFEKARIPKLGTFVTLTEYADDIDAECAYPPSAIHMGIGEYMEKLGKTQLRIAETEKYAHVTFFFSGGREDEYKGEDRVLVPSPQVATYDLEPEMSAPEVTDRLCDAIVSGKYDLIVCNYANGDMVGHTGNFEAAVKAAECVDVCVQRVCAAVERMHGHCLITADHGNLEEMIDHSGEAHTQHTTGPVPLVYVGDAKVSLNEGSLSDIAPTLLALMGLDQPEEMSGHSLIRPLA